jgi:photosystem II stability/assembly factor-like uncharacterized protein
LFAAVLGHPYGPNAMRGIYRSLDGGGTWQRVLYKDNDTGGSAVALDPSHPEIVYAGLWQSRLGPWEDKNEFNGTGGGLFKSTDGGTTWRQLKTGLPADLAQINIAVAPSEPTRLYAAVATTEPGEYYSAAGLGVFRSDDGGESWRRITTDPRPALRIGGGDLTIIRVDPTNADVVYSTGIVTMKSVDGGRTWQPLRGAPGGDDYQNLWINPVDPHIIALVSDQGAVITVNGGESWSSWFTEPTAQLYHVSVAPTFPYRVCAAQQESGSVCIASRGNDGEITERDWHPVGVIEYGYVAPDPLDPDVIYGAGRSEVSKYHWSTGQVQNVTPIPVRSPDVRVDRTEPLMFSPLDPHTLYYGANRLYRTRDGGVNWQAISPDLAREAGNVPASVGALHLPGAEKQRGVIYSLGPSPLNIDLLWAGTDDGYVWLTSDGGANWANVTPPALTPWSKVTQIEPSHFDADSVYISVSRMRIDDLHPYIYRTRDRGRSWTAITDGLPPDAPVNAVREDPARRGLLFAATETGVWVSYDDGGHWQSLQLNLPHTSVRDLWIHEADLIAATHGRSLWILDDISRVRQLEDGALPRAAVLYHPAAAYRMHRSTWTDTPMPPDEPMAENPPAGAVIDYFLPRAPAHPVVLEVQDSHGALVRRYRSDDAPVPSPEELAREIIPRYWIATPGVLPARAGMHRWVWDLRYAAPVSTTHGYPISAVPHATPEEPLGPLALPGRYLVRLTVDGRHYEVPLDVKPDPRVGAPASALEAQLALARQLADLVTDSSRAVLSARSIDAQLKALKPAGATADAVHAYQQRLADLLGTGKKKPGEEAAQSAGTAPQVSLPDLQERVAGLYGEVTRADAAPTAAQRSATDAAQEALAGKLAEWHKLAADLTALNRQLQAAKLAEVRPDLAPPRDQDIADRD